MIFFMVEKMQMFKIFFSDVGKNLFRCCKKLQYE